MAKKQHLSKLETRNDQVTPAETSEILHLASECLKVQGDFIELGCYRGDTSVLLGKLLRDQDSSILPPKRLWIYDSFAGLPAKTPEDASGAGYNFQAGELLVTKREVIDKLHKNGIKNTIVKKAWFDQLTDPDLPSEIAFAFCDGDLYASIKTSLALVRPRLSKKGIIVVHDYNNPELPGSARAVDEFLRSFPDFRLSVRYTLAILRKEC